MPAAPIPQNEAERIQSLHQLQVLDSSAEEELDALVRVAALICDVPISLISLVDTQRQWFKANVGLPGVNETPRDLAFCAYSILNDELLEVEDATKDDRFSDNVLVTSEPDIRFYAGVPLRLNDGAAVGSLCVIDRMPRTLNENQREILINLGKVASQALEGRRAILTERAHLEEHAFLTSLLHHSVDAVFAIDLEGIVNQWSPGAIKLYGYPKIEMIGQSINKIIPIGLQEEESTRRSNNASSVGSVYETVRVHQDGTLIPVSVSMTPVNDKFGNVIGLTKIDHNIQDRLEREREILKSESRFRTLSESAPMGVYETDAEGSCLYTNARWQEIFGLDRDECMGNGWALTIHSDDRAKVFSEWQRTASLKIEFDMEFKIRRKDGSGRTVHSRARPVLDESKNIVGFIGNVEDITERRALFKKLEYNERKFRRLYESTPSMLFSIDDVGRIVSVSDYWLIKMGYVREEIERQEWLQFLTAPSRIYAKTKVLPVFFELGFCDQVEFQMTKKTGEVIDVLFSAVMESEETEEKRSLAIIEDVTLRRIAEHALKETSTSLNFILEGTQAGTWEWNVSTGEVIINEKWAELVGYTLEELSPISIETWTTLTHPEDLKTAKVKLDNHFVGVSPFYESEIRMRHKNGEWIWILARGKMRTWIDGNQPEWILGTHLDISLRKRQEEAVSLNQAMLNRTGRLANVGGWEVDLQSDKIYWSDETCRIHGVMAGHIPSMEEAIHFYAPEARPIILSAIEKGIQSGEGWDLELPFNRANGERIWVHVVGYVEYLNGNPIRLIGAIQDISNEIAQRQSVIDANERLKLAADSGAIGIWEFDVIHNKVKWDSWMFRLYGIVDTPSDDTYTLWAKHLHHEDKAAAELALQEALEGKKLFNTEFRIVWADGSIHHIRGSGSVTRDANGPIRMVGVNWDVTEQRELASKLAQQHELLQTTLKSIGDAVITTDAEGFVNWLNPIAERLTGWSNLEAHGEPLRKIFHIINEETRAQTENPIETCLTQGKVVGLANHTVLIAKDGSEFGIEDSAAPIRNERGQLLGAVLVFHDVTEQRRMSGEMSFRATHDSLTGLINRAEFEARLRKILNKSHEDKSEHALLFIDLDQFKLVNDACGHTIGDQLLQQVSKLLSDTVRSRDTLARLGGDEFAVILEQCSSEQAQRVAQAICDRMDDFRFMHDEKRFRIGASIGLVPVDARWSTMSAVLQAADTSCYAAKEAGRNRVHTWFDTDLAMRARHGEMQWATRIEQAIDENRFELYAQKIEPIDGQECGIHAEVLLRMIDHDGAIVPPGAFLPAAERFHLVTRVDKWVVKNAINWLIRVPQQNLIEVLSINLSGQSIGDKAFHRHLIDILEKLEPSIRHRLCFEITETAAITNLVDASIFIDEVKAFGVKIALDDFGAGASSFGYLKKLSIDFLKIDGQFVRDLIEDPLDAAAVRCFADVAKVVGVKTIAEFVERTEVLNRLREIGIDYAQGYLLHRPEPILLFSDSLHHGVS